MDIYNHLIHNLFCRTPSTGGPLFTQNPVSIYKYTYINIYLCMYIYIYIYIWTYIYLCIYLYVWIWIFIYISNHIQLQDSFYRRSIIHSKSRLWCSLLSTERTGTTFICMFMYICMYICIHIYTHTYERVGVVLHIYAYIYMYVYTYIWIKQIKYMYIDSDAYGAH
jgi:hypothetical protein